MKIYLVRRPPRLPRQREFTFLERRRRHERWFKRLILLGTLLVLAEVLWASPWGRYGAGTAAAEARHVVREVLGLPEPREEVDAAWRRYRELGIETSRRALERVYAEEVAPMRRLMRYAGLDPEHGLHRWGNYNVTLLLPSTVFEADDEARSYRFRPNTQSIWLRNLTIKQGTIMFFLVPDGPGLAEAIRGTPAIPIETSRQSTNSWGLRGPEPDLDATLRGLVLGDSYMQGMNIGDDQTPPECLRRYLERETGTRVSILNTGVMGYSPEQYYYSLKAFADRFRPHFVIVSIFTNDFGGVDDVAMKGQGDWAEGKYWLDRIVEYCRLHRLPHVVVSVPLAMSMFSRRRTGFYPGMIANILEDNGLMFLNPTESFINAHLERWVAMEEGGVRPKGCSLFNEAIGDGHFSPAGSEVWARTVGRRLVLLMEKDHGIPSTSSRLPHEKATVAENPRTARRPDPPADHVVRREESAP